MWHNVCSLCCKTLYFKLILRETVILIINRNIELNHFNSVIKTIAFWANLNSHLSKLGRRRRVWESCEKSHPIGPGGVGWCAGEGVGGSNRPKITSHNLQAASYLPSSLRCQLPSLNNQTHCLLCRSIMASLVVKNKKYTTFDQNKIKLPVNVGSIKTRKSYAYYVL